MVPITMSTSLAAAVLVWASILHLIAASTFDGLPCPKGFPNAPTTAYGKFPPTYISMNQIADYDWYGFANLNYPADIGLQCLAYAYKTEIVDEANQGTLQPYNYIKCYSSSSNVCYDSVWHNYYCLVGCFYLENSSLPLPSVTALPPPAPGNSVPGNSTPGNTTPRVNRGSGVLQPSSLCGGVILAVVGLFNRW